MKIHPSAIIDPLAEIGANVEIGPFSYIGPHCRVGEGSKIGNNVTLQEYVTLGQNCQVFSGAVLGGSPQDMKFKGEESYVVVGENSVFREYVTINRASGEFDTTEVGRGCMLMAYSHLGHNCKLGNEVIIANSTHLGGYVEVGDYAFLSALGLYHQFVKVGKLAMVGGGSSTRQDVPPFCLGSGYPMDIIGINKVGLRRRGYDLNARTRINKAYKLLFFSDVNTTQAIEIIASEIGLEDPSIQELIHFVQTSSRGIRKPSHKQSASSAETQEPELVEII